MKKIIKMKKILLTILEIVVMFFMILALLAVSICVFNFIAR